MYYFDIRHKHERPMCTREWLLELELYNCWEIKKIENLLYFQQTLS